MYILNNPIKSLIQYNQLYILLNQIYTELDNTSYKQLAIDLYIGDYYQSYLSWEAGTVHTNKKVKRIKGKDLKNNLIPNFYIGACSIFKLDGRFFAYSINMQEYMKNNLYKKEVFQNEAISTKLKEIMEHPKLQGLCFNFEVIEDKESSLKSALKTKFKILEC